MNLLKRINKLLNLERFMVLEDLLIEARSSKMVKLAQARNIPAQTNQ